MAGDLEVTSNTTDTPLQKLLTAAYTSADSFMRNSRYIHLIPKQSHSEKASKKKISKVITI